MFSQENIGWVALVIVIPFVRVEGHRFTDKLVFECQFVNALVGNKIVNAQITEIS